jgi:hypothetical protein
MLNSAAKAIGRGGSAVLPGDRHRACVGGLEADVVVGLEQLIDAERVAADRQSGLALGAGDGERGDEGALGLRVPAVDARAARDRRELEEVAEVGEIRFAGNPGGAAAIADDGNAHRRA